INHDGKSHSSSIHTFQHAESDYIRIKIDQIEKLSSVIDDLKVSKIEIIDHCDNLKELQSLVNDYMHEIRKIKYKIHSNMEINDDSHQVLYTSNNYLE